jgi:tetratricopeptide (TPR) repeat protein
MGVAALLAPPLVPGLSAQRVRTAEAQALRDAGAHEARGRLTDAEAILQQLLEELPTSAGGLFALERVLRSQGRVVAVLPAADRFLSAVPEASGVRYLKLRVLAEVDSMDAMLRETDAWIWYAPADPLLYRQALPLWERVYGPEQALELLSRGRLASGDPVTLALDIGDLLMSAGRTVDAVAEWARATGSAGERGAEILRRLAQIDNTAVRARAVEALVDALERAPTTPERRILAVQVALSLRRIELGLGIANTLARQLDPTSRRAFLESVSGWGKDGGAVEATLWALTELRESMGQGEETRAIDLRISQTALLAGDTATAIEAGRRLANSLPAGSPERRRFLAEGIRMRARPAEAIALSTALDAFRLEFPSAPELDGLAAMVSVRLQAGGEVDRAAAVLTAVEGPETSLERAYLFLSSGDVALARAALIAAVDGLSPARATDAIQLASLLGRLSAAGTTVVAQAAVEGHRGRGRQAALALEKRVPELPATDRPIALAEAARLAVGGGGTEDAARMHTVLVQSYPDAAEAAEAALALARWHARTRSGMGTAVQLLEGLILKDPGSSIAPEARRELQRLKGIS